MKLLLDQGLPRSAAGRLGDRGLDADHVGDRGMGRATDRAILELARRESRAVVTLDADFHAMLALEHASSPSVVRLRVQGLRAEETADLVARIVHSCSDDLNAGAVVTSDGVRVRVRRLPIE